eukprot:4108355-Alexandrium_andersonii.AAC.1
MQHSNRWILDGWQNTAAPCRVMAMTMLTPKAMTMTATVTMPMATFVLTVTALPLVSVMATSSAMN